MKRGKGWGLEGETGGMGGGRGKAVQSLLRCSAGT